MRLGVVVPEEGALLVHRSEGPNKALSLDSTSVDVGEMGGDGTEARSPDLTCDTFPRGSSSTIASFSSSESAVRND